MSFFGTPRAKPDFNKLSDDLQRLATAEYESVAASSDSSDWPKISVITPSYNQAEFLERTIRSVLNQNYPNLEYIVMDGGSTDRSVDIIRKYEDDLAYWRSAPDGGQTSAIIEGLRRATGDWVAFQNSDDLYFPGAFAAVAQAIKTRPETDVVTGDVALIDGKERILDVVLIMPPKLWIQILLGTQYHNQSTFWRRSLLEEFGYPDAGYRFAFDYEFFTRLLAGGARVKRLDQYLGAFRFHAATKSMTIRDVGHEERGRAARAYGIAALALLPDFITRNLARLAKAAYHASRGEFWYLTRTPANLEPKILGARLSRPPESENGRESQRNN